MYWLSAWFSCSCCPVNLARFIPSIGGYVLARTDDAIYVNLFLSGGADVKLGNRAVKLTQQTDYPWDGKVNIQVDPAEPQATALGYVHDAAEVDAAKFPRFEASQNCFIPTEYISRDAKSVCEVNLKRDVEHAVRGHYAVRREIPDELRGRSLEAGLSIRRRK